MDKLYYTEGIEEIECGESKRIELKGVYVVEILKKKSSKIMWFLCQVENLSNSSLKSTSNLRNRVFIYLLAAERNSCEALLCRGYYSAFIQSCT